MTQFIQRMIEVHSLLRFDLTYNVIVDLEAQKVALNRSKVLKFNLIFTKPTIFCF